MRGGIQAYVNSLPRVPDNVVPAGPVRVPYAGVCSCLSNLGGCYIDAARPPGPTFTCKCVMAKGWWSGKIYACFGIGYRLALGEENTGGGHSRDQCLNGAKSGYYTGNCGGYIEEFGETAWEQVRKNVTMRLFAPHALNSTVSECNIWEQGKDIQCKIKDKGVSVDIPSGLNPALPVKILIHGFADDIRLRTEAVPKYMEKYSGNVNVILVNWASMARVLHVDLDNLDNGFYYRAARNAMIVGEYLGRCLALTSLQTGLQSENIHVIGHSLGGQMLGTLGRSYTNWRQELGKLKFVRANTVGKDKVRWIMDLVFSEKKKSEADKLNLVLSLLDWSSKDLDDKARLILNVLGWNETVGNQKVSGMLLDLAGLHRKEYKEKVKWALDLIGWRIRSDEEKLKWILKHLGLGGNGKKIGRLTALDPAGPGFVDGDVYADPRLFEARLQKDAAIFVDVIHTNAGSKPVLLNYNDPFKMRLGDYGPNGHIDFYPDGGDLQQGCNPSGAHALLRIGCSHERSYQYFIDSINDRPDKCMHGWHKGRKICMGELAQNEWEYLGGDGDIETKIELESTEWYDQHRTGLVQDFQNTTRFACKALLNTFREYVDPLLCRDAWPNCLLSTGN